MDVFPPIIGQGSEWSLAKTLISDLGVTGGNKKSGYYHDGERQKRAFDNEDIVKQLEAQNSCESRTTKIKQNYLGSAWQKQFKQFRGMRTIAPQQDLHYGNGLKHKYAMY